MGEIDWANIKESVEEYLDRFYSLIDVLGGDVLPEVPECHSLALTDNIEENALAMRGYLHIAEFGPVRKCSVGKSDSVDAELQ